MRSAHQVPKCGSVRRAADSPGLCVECADVVDDTAGHGASAPAYRGNGWADGRCGPISRGEGELYQTHTVRPSRAGKLTSPEAGSARAKEGGAQYGRCHRDHADMPATAGSGAPRRRDDPGRQVLGSIAGQLRSLVSFLRAFEEI